MLTGQELIRQPGSSKISVFTPLLRFRSYCLLDCTEILKPIPSILDLTSPCKQNYEPRQRDVGTQRTSPSYNCLTRLFVTYRVKFQKGLKLAMFMKVNKTALHS